MTSTGVLPHSGILFLCGCWAMASSSQLRHWEHDAGANHRGGAAWLGG